MQDENLRVAALQAGDVDLIEYVPWQSMATIEQDPKLALQTTNGPFMYLIFNGKAGPFGDARVRRAIAHAIRREEIVKAAFFGRGAPMEGIPIAESSPFYDTKLAHGWPYDPAKAKALLKEAGTPSGFSAQAAGDRAIRHAQGHRHGGAAAPGGDRHPGGAGAAGLGDAGQSRQSRAVRIRRRRHRRRQQRPGRAGVAAGQQRAGSYVRSYGIPTPELDQLLAAGRAEFDEAKRKTIYDKMQDVALAEATLVGLCWRSQGYGMSRRVHGFHNMPAALTFYSGTTFEDVDIA